MLIGVSTSIYWNYERLNLIETVKHTVQDLGFEAVEIHCEDPFFKGWMQDEGEKTKSNIKDLLSTLGVEVSLHAPYHDLNLSTLNYGVRKEVMRQMEECIKTANLLDSDIVVVHPGYKSSRKFLEEKVFGVMVRNLDNLCRTAEDYGVNICLENLSSHPKALCTSIDDFQKVFERIDCENFFLTLDFAHANTTTDGPLKFAEQLKDKVKHLHISDNVGIDSHKLIGQGNIDFKKVLKELKDFGGIGVLEGWIPDGEDPFIKMEKKSLEKILDDLVNG